MLNAKSAGTPNTRSDIQRNMGSYATSIKERISSNRAEATYATRLTECRVNMVFTSIHAH
jgi:hypothetical protein